MAARTALASFIIITMSSACNRRWLNFVRLASTPKSSGRDHVTDSPAEALRRRSEALVLIVGYQQTGWGVTTRRTPSGPLLHTIGDTIDDACAAMLVKLDEEPPKRKLVLKR